MTSDLLMASGCPKFLEVVNDARQLASSEKDILLRGDTGTGKELFASMIHQLSYRKDKPYEVVNISSYNDNLFESEVFGYEAGAFTGANKNGKKGALEDAADGTLFLDEIGNLSTALQAKLLRVLENRQFRRVGGNEHVCFRARVITATSRDLETMLDEGNFALDLYHRLGIELRIPPLRERREDIPDMVRNFLIAEIKGSATPVPEWVGEEQILFVCNFFSTVNYPWPGNVRELKKMVGEVFELCIRNGSEERFQSGVLKIVGRKCRNRRFVGHNEVTRGLSNLIYDYLSDYKETDSSLRTYIDNILIEAIGSALDMAVVNRKYLPDTMKELGARLGIPSLYYANRDTLARHAPNDYMRDSLENLNPNDSYPEVFNEVIRRCQLTTSDR